MSVRKKIFLYSLLSLFASLIFIQFELREYYRYTPSNYYPLKFVLQYGAGILISLITTIYTIKIFIKEQSFFRIMPIIIILIGSLITSEIRQKTINIDKIDVTIIDGYYCNSRNGIKLDGVYKSASMWDGFGDDEHCTKQQYKKGIPVGKWMYSHKEYLIHSGIYITDSSLTNNIRTLSNSKRVDLNLWMEADYSYLSINLINPKIKDSILLEKIDRIASEKLKQKYKFRELIVSAEN